MPRSDHELLVRAALFQALARGFHYPTPDQAADLRTRLDRQIAQRAQLPQTPLDRALRAARRAWTEVSLPVLEAEYARLFLTGFTCPLHETAYGDGRRMAGRTAEIADISGFYLAFGLQPSAREADLPDHLCAELEFYSVLLLKQAYAQSRRWTARDRLARRAARIFMDDHLGRWVRAFHDSLQEQAPPPAYATLARLLVTAVEAECRRLRIHPRLLSGRIMGDDMQNEAFVCPHAGAEAGRNASPAWQPVFLAASHLPPTASPGS